MITIGMEELERARRLQEEASKLHLPSPPVASFKISRKEPNGQEKDLIYAKSNSYLRNAYNTLAHVLTFASGAIVNPFYFGDGSISYRDRSGNILTTPPPVFSGSNETVIEVRLGTNGTPDTLDDISLEEVPSSAWVGSITRFSTFDASSRRFITYIMRVMTNRSQTTYHIRESGILARAGEDFCLMVRDTFPSVTFAPGDRVTFTYQLEVYYP